MRHFYKTNIFFCNSSFIFWIITVSFMIYFFHNSTVESVADELYFSNFAAKKGVQIPLPRGVWDLFVVNICN